MNEEPKITTHTNPWHFFALALCLSWLFWIPLALLGQDAMRFPFVALMIAGGLSPAIAEVILIAKVIIRCSVVGRNRLSEKALLAGEV